MHLNNEFLTQLRSQVDVVEIISAKVELQKKSTGRYVGLCPFHDEKTPSFYVHSEMGYYCFGCGEKGDAIAFLMTFNKQNFTAVVTDLCDRYNLAPDKRETWKRVVKQIDRQKKAEEAEQDKLDYLKRLCEVMIDSLPLCDRDSLAYCLKKCGHAIAQFPKDSVKETFLLDFCSGKMAAKTEIMSKFAIYCDLYELAKCARG